MALILVGALLMFLLGQDDFAAVRGVCKDMALLSVSMQHPAAGAAALAGQVQQAAAQVAPPTLATTARTTLSTTTGGTTPTTKAALPVTGGTIPKKAADAGKVLTQMLAGDKGVGGIAVKNRSGKAISVPDMLKKKLELTVDVASKQPQVLIVHTHTTENFLTYDAGFYNPADIARTKDMTRNICAAGKALCETLNARGVVSIHDTTIHDNPQYTGAYERSEKTVKALLKRYPSVKVVLDIHRDAIMPDSTTHVKPTASVDGRPAAQLMIVAGTVNTTALPHPNWQKNMAFAVQLQKKLTDTHKNLMRPLYVVASRYNQHLSAGYLLIEVGSDVNTVEEAEYSAQLLGKTLADFLKK